jgi:hypothetical protein
MVSTEVGHKYWTSRVQGFKSLPRHPFYPAKKVPLVNEKLKETNNKSLKLV